MTSPNLWPIGVLLLLLAGFWCVYQMAANPHSSPEPDDETPPAEPVYDDHEFGDPVG